jgi:hypothetical protein
VLIVAADLVGDDSGIATAREFFRSVNSYLHDWYGERVGAVYVLTDFLIIRDTRPAAEWIRLSEISTVANHRFDYLQAAYNLVAPFAVQGKRYAVSVYAGYQPDAWLGAASRGAVAVSAPRSASVMCPPFTVANDPPVDTRCADAVYAMGHELGHTFGLAHSCDVYSSESRCWDSMMQVGKPPTAILLPGEVDALRATPWFGG